jgi:hypothetical protein
MNERLPRKRAFIKTGSLIELINQKLPYAPKLTRLSLHLPTKLICRVLTSLHIAYGHEGLLNERIHRQPVHINRPVRPSRSFPLIATVQISWNSDIFPLGIEAGFVEVHFSDLNTSQSPLMLLETSKEVLTLV